LEYFMDVWDILWPFGTFCVHFVHFLKFWYHAPRKIWQPWLDAWLANGLTANTFVHIEDSCDQISDIFLRHFILKKNSDLRKKTSPTKSWVNCWYPFFFVLEIRRWGRRRLFEILGLGRRLLFETQHLT
jgi:hypothetical protein